MKRTIKSIMFLCLLMFTAGALQAQTDKGVTSIGKEVDCTTINPSVDQTVNQYGEIVTKPSLTRNGMLITADCCPTLLQGNLTDTVTCVSISIAAVITDGTVNTAVLQVFSDANRTNQVGNDIATTVTDETVKGKATGLTCYTRYYFRLKLNNQCNYDWTDSTRDATLDQTTFCTVANPRTNNASTTDKSHEHLIEGTNTIDSVYDMQGNAYTVVQIGTQCWLKQNMRCTESPSGNLNKVTNSSTNNFKPRYYDYSSGQEITSIRDRGYLYNWPGAMDIDDATNEGTQSKNYANRRGICPWGWHIPTNREWTTLELLYLVDANGNPITNAALNNNNAYRGYGVGKLVGGCKWTSNAGATTPGNYSYPERNVSGLTAYPVGFRNSDGEFTGTGSRSMFWSASSCNNNDAYARYIIHNSEGVNRYTSNFKDGFSVRCVRNAAYAVFPVVDSVTCTSMMLSAQVVGLNNLTNKTVAVYTNEACTAAATANVNITISNDTISAVITGLSCNTRYYIKVTATDGSHPVEAVVSDSTRDMTMEKATFCTVISALALSEGSSDLSHEHLVEGSTTEIDSVYDHEGNRYAVVQIGNQCWLKSNMRCTTSPNGILQSGSGDYVHSPRYYQPGEASVSQCGYLYNWAGAMDVADGSAVTSLLAKHRGICPAGWHVPDTTEWINLGISLVGTSISNHSRSGTNYYADNTPIAAILAGSCDWKIADDPSNKPGDYSNSERNSSGFGLYPSPNYYSWAVGTFTSVGRSCYLWTANSLSETKAARFVLHCDWTGIGIGGADDGSTPHKQAGRNVRCVRDTEIPVTISFDANGGTGAMTQMSVNALANTVLKSNAFTHTGNFVFAGWSTEKCSTDITYTDGATINPTGDLTLYAQWHTYCTGNPTVGRESGNGRIDSVKDHQNNWYKVVQIGNQCWLKENMRATTNNAGTPILKSSLDETSPPEQSAYYYNNDNSNLRKYGCLYNFPAANNICPSGWHIPSAEDWISLANGANVQLLYGTISYADYDRGLGKLTGGCDWPEFNSGTYPGNYTYTDRNSTGFSVLPAGYLSDDGNFVSVNSVTNFWGNLNGTALAFHFSQALEYILAANQTMNPGYSVRCVRDDN